MNKIPIVVCNVDSPSIKVLKSSVEAYAPEHELIVFHKKKSTFGESYNEALDLVFRKYDEVIVANDDVVITPNTIPNLLDDVKILKEKVDEGKLGFVGAMHDQARPGQNIRYKNTAIEEDEIIGGRWKSEDYIKDTLVVAPVFAYLSKQAFEAAQFPPIDWCSDDIICLDLYDKGYRHFISRAYCHHLGSMTIGKDIQKCIDEALPWVRENKRVYLNELIKRGCFGDIPFEEDPPDSLLYEWNKDYFAKQKELKNQDVTDVEEIKKEPENNFNADQISSSIKTLAALDPNLLSKMISGFMSNNSK